MNFREYKWLLPISASALAGGIAFTQGFSFARWHEFDEVGDKLNEHAYLIGACGFGVFVCAECVRRLFKRIEALEEELRRDRGTVVSINQP